MRISDWSSDVCSSDLILLLTKLPNLIVRHIGEICRQPLGRRCFRKRTRKFSGVTSLTAIDNGQAPCRGCSQCSWLLARAHQSGIQAREIATDPARLLSCERLRKLLAEPPLFQGQGTPRRVRCCPCASVLGIQLPCPGLH